MPFGPHILWAVSDRRSTPSASTSMGTLPTACAASVWSRMPRGRVSPAISEIGCRTPISLLAAITETRRVSGRNALSTSPTSQRPSGRGST